MVQRLFLVADTTANQVPESKINDAKIYVSVVNLPTQDHVNNQKLVLKKQLIGVNINLKRQIKCKTDIFIFLIEEISLISQ